MSPGVIGSPPKAGVDKNLLSEMVKRGLCRLTFESQPADALRHFFSPKDQVGLKVNCLAGRMASTHPELALVMASLLKEIDIKPKDIIIWDRSSDELNEIGFPVSFSGDEFRCFGTDTKGVGYSYELIEHKNIGSLLSQVMEKFTNVH
jgi:hypothetical protein